VILLLPQTATTLLELLNRQTLVTSISVHPFAVQEDTNVDEQW